MRTLAEDLRYAILAFAGMVIMFVVFKLTGFPDEERSELPR